jgi:hypothetical protein
MNNYMQMKNENKFKKNESQESQPHESSNLKLNLKLNSNLNNHDSLSALLDDNNQEEEEELTTIHNAIENLVKEEKHLEAARVIRKIRKQKQKQQQQSLATSTSTSTSTQTSKSKSNSKQQQQQLFDNEYYTTIIQKAELIEYVHPVLYVIIVIIQLSISFFFFFFFFFPLLVLIYITTCLVSDNKNP